MVMFLQEAVAVLGMACYINGSMPSMLLLAHNFAADFKEGVLANANCGGKYWEVVNEYAMRLRTCMSTLRASIEQSCISSYKPSCFEVMLGVG